MAVKTIKKKKAGAKSSYRMPPKPDAKTMAKLIRDGKVPPHYAIPHSEGDAAVQAWIKLLPRWQGTVARGVDAVVTRELPDVHKAVKWHGVWYGVPGKSWFLAISSFKAHVKLGFFDGTSLKPVPPVPLKSKPMAALDVRKDDTLDEARLAGWVKQAMKLPGWGKA